MTQPLIGIDLGTTYSLIAVFEQDGPRVLEDSLGERLIPSAVAMAPDGTLLVGAPALALCTTRPDQTVRWFKRDMGTDKTYALGPRSFRPEELSALVLKEVKMCAEQALGCAIREAVVTVPAYFGELQRRATRDACELAGLEVERIINEPTAAALAYGLHQRDREFRAIVLDLGGGTFDVTLLEVMEGVVEIQASAGDSRLGGEDFADYLTVALAAQVKQKYDLEVPRGTLAWARLREASERAKRQLSERALANIALPALEANGSGCDVELEVSRPSAESTWTELLERLKGPVRRVLRDAGVDPAEVDEVLLVGGATRMPVVVELAAKLFGRLPLRSLPADEAVVQGAAVQAALKAGAQAVDDLVVTDVAPFSLGIATGEVVGGQTIQGVFSPIIERGTVLPASRVETFATLSDGQKQLKVDVYQGEHSLCKDNQSLGSYTVKGIPPAPAGEQTVEIRFTYDLNGILDVDTMVVATQKTASLTIEQSPGKLDKAALKRAKSEMARLKFHPRDALPNVTALNRADALHVELTGPERHNLARYIAAFRVAMERQDSGLIQETRGELLRYMASLR